MRGRTVPKSYVRDRRRPGDLEDRQPPEGEPGSGVPRRSRSGACGRAASIRRLSVFHSLPSTRSNAARGVVPDVRGGLPVALGDLAHGEDRRRAELARRARRRGRRRRAIATSPSWCAPSRSWSATVRRRAPASRPGRRRRRTRARSGSACPRCAGGGRRRAGARADAARRLPQLAVPALDEVRRGRERGRRARARARAEQRPEPADEALVARRVERRKHLGARRSPRRSSAASAAASSGARSVSGAPSIQPSSCASCTSRSRTTPISPRDPRELGRSSTTPAGRTSVEQRQRGAQPAARHAHRRAAPRCRRRSASRAPAEQTPRSAGAATASATSPIVSVGWMAVRPNVSDLRARDARARRGRDSYLLSTAGCRPHATRRRSTSGSTARARAPAPRARPGAGGSGCPRPARGSWCRRARARPLGSPPAASGKVRRRVCTSKSGTSCRVPTSARTRSPTGPGACAIAAGVVAVERLLELESDAEAAAVALVGRE